MDNFKLNEAGDDNSCSSVHISKPSPLSEVENLPLALLSPDHPLLKNFQSLLREYLLRTKEQLSNEIAEMEHQIKLKEQQREEEGAKLYGMQQEIHHQNKQLEEYSEEIQEHVEHRQNEEQAVAYLKTEYGNKLLLQKDNKIMYNKRMVDLEHMQHLENNFHKWTYEMEDEVKNVKRVLSRDAQLQQQLSEEKRKSDMLFLHLNMEVKKHEKELDIVHEQLLELQEVINVLTSSLSYANTDLEALQNEHKRLIQAWGEVIVAISHRDKIKHQVYEAIDKQKELIKLSSFGTEAVKKHIAKELLQHDKLDAFKDRLANDLTNLKRECQKEMDTLAALALNFEEMPLWLDRTDKDLNEAKREGSNLETEIRRTQWKIDKNYNQKFQIEESILKLAQEQLITDKASEYRLKLLRNAQDHRRGIELTLAQSQTLLAETLLEIENLHGRLFELGQENELLKGKLRSAEAEYDHLNTELKTIETQLDMKMKLIDTLSSKCDQLLRSTEGSEVSPTELKVKILEKVLHAAEQQIREHQQFWLMLQNHFVNLSQKRNNQMNEIQITHKQLSIIKQKSLKVDYDLEISEGATRELNKNIQVVASKVELLNEKMFRKRQQHDLEETECELEHCKLLQKLKDNEMHVLGLEAEIDDIRSDIEHYNNLVLNKHREALSWETKYKIIEETLYWRKQEISLNSEIGTMKTEIHRMKIRFNQLKRAQEKLMQDLEHCVMHREHIFVTASTKQRIESKPQRSKATTTTQQSITDLRNKLKQTQGEIRSLTNNELVDICREQELARNTIKQLRADTDRETALDELIGAEIKQNILLKHLNLESIVSKQNRAKSYCKLKSGSQPPKTLRSETILELQTQKLIINNDNLVDAIQSLSVEIPEMKIFFIKVLQILKDSERQ